MIKTIDRATCEMIRKQVDAVLEVIGKEHGIVIKSNGGGTFTSNNFTFRVEASVVGDGGIVHNKETEEFKQLATLYRMKAEDLGKVVMIQGDKYEITGMKSRSYKFPVLAKKLSNGKVYKFPVHTIKVALGYKVDDSGY